MPETVMEVESGLEASQDLKVQSEQIDRLDAKIHELQKLTGIRISNFETNLRQLKRNRDERVNELRQGYDACLNKGDAKGAGDCIKQIAAVRKDLENLARQVLDSDIDTADLKQKSNELRLEAIALYQNCLANFKESQKQMIRASGFVGRASLDVDIMKMDTVIAESKKAAQAILDE